MNALPAMAIVGKTEDFYTSGSPLAGSILARSHHEFRPHFKAPWTTLFYLARANNLGMRNLNPAQRTIPLEEDPSRRQRVFSARIDNRPSKNPLGRRCH